ncbi:MAG TPA: DUF6249 domain-containing protein [Ktedonobacterales bacterium]
MTSVVLVGLEWLGSLALFLGFILLIRFLDHRERMAMIDRGLTPPDRLRAAGRKGGAVLRGGLITGSVGIAVTLGLYMLGYLLPPPFSAIPGRLGPWLLPGLIPLGVGAALVASHYLAPAPPPPDERAATDISATAPSARAPVVSGPDVGRALGRIIPWRLFGRAETAETAAPLGEAAGGEPERTENGLERHG